MTTERLTRRRALGLLAAAAGLPLVLRATRATAEVVTWHGRALGAPATLILHHPHRPTAERLVAACVAELDRLEAILSLYRPASALCELNRTGALAAPPPALVSILADCRSFHAATAGAFDPTVQPLWRLYATHFQSGGDPAGPAPDAVAAARASVGLDAVHASPDRVVLARPGMALTLNGIAQGWITDRLIDLLRGAGVTSTLVDMGEIRALGTWRVGRRRQRHGARPHRPRGRHLGPAGLRLRSGAPLHPSHRPAHRRDAGPLRPGHGHRLDRGGRRRALDRFRADGGNPGDPRRDGRPGGAMTRG